MQKFLLWLFQNSAYGLTFLRLIMGSIFIFTGLVRQHHMGYFVYFFSQLGIQVPSFLGWGLSFIEVAGGLLLLVGIFTRYLGLLFMAVFAFTTAVIAISDGIIMARFEFMLLVCSFLLATQGGGRFAVDRPGRRWEPFSERRGLSEDRWLWEGEAKFTLPHHFDGRLLNINREGAKIAIGDTDISVGSLVTVKISFSQFDLEQGPLELVGTVRWINGEGPARTIGLKFDQTDPFLERMFQKEKAG